MLVHIIGEKNNMKCIQPIGQYFVIQEMVSLNYWLGNQGSNEFEDATDYQIACETEMYIKKIDYGEFEILIIGEEPTQMFVYEFEGNHYFVRWIYAPKNFNIEEHKLIIANLNVSSQIEQSFNIKFRNLDLVLHHAAYVGSEDPEVYEFRALSNNILIDTYSYEPDEEIKMIVHKFNYC